MVKTHELTKKRKMKLEEDPGKMAQDLCHRVVVVVVVAVVVTEGASLEHGGGRGQIPYRGRMLTPGNRLLPRVHRDSNAPAPITRTASLHLLAVHSPCAPVS